MAGIEIVDVVVVVGHIALGGTRVVDVLVVLDVSVAAAEIVVVLAVLVATVVVESVADIALVGDMFVASLEVAVDNAIAVQGCVAFREFVAAVWVAMVGIGFAAFLVVFGKGQHFYSSAAVC